jgi:periplasmic divalent cation tolerance protein
VASHASYYQVLTTLASREDAAALARVVLERRAAACVQVLGPIESHYWWQGEIQTEQEWLCQIKTAAEVLDRLMALVKERHPYDVPEITATPIARGSEEYLRWVGAETQA